MALEPSDCLVLAEELGMMKESEGAADEQEEVEVCAVPAELQEIVDKAGFLAAQ